MKKTIKSFLPVAQAIEKLLHPYAEVVVHDIKLNQIVAIYNPFSKRRIGDPSLLTQEELHTLTDCIGPYDKTNWDGAKLKSVSSVIRDENQKAVGLLCINLAISSLVNIQQHLATFLACQSLQPAPLFKDDWQERINNYIHHYLTENHLSLEALRRQEKKDLIAHLYKTGAFSGKNAALYIAKVIKISRASVYNYLAKEQV